MLDKHSVFEHYCTCSRLRDREGGEQLESLNVLEHNGEFWIELWILDFFTPAAAE